mmetsp:Transcript_55520/g.119836  ORF Transcript_55520/g.119836 Transcript_55520/m.119836 type:complete len:253 (-) Transcript_55520:209-967(-)
MVEDVWMNVVLATIIFAISAYYLLRTEFWTGTRDGGPSKGHKTAMPPSHPSEAARGSSRSASAMAAAATGAGMTAKAAAATKSKEQFTGVVKRYSERNGMGFITCGPMREKHGVDVRVYREEFEGAALAVGDHCTFHAVLGGRPNCSRNHPWATDVKRLDSPPEGDDGLEIVDVPAGTSRSSTAGPAGQTGQADEAFAQTPEASVAKNILHADAPAFVPASSSSPGISSRSNTGGMHPDAPEFIPAVRGPTC